VRSNDVCVTSAGNQPDSEMMIAVASISSCIIDDVRYTLYIMWL